VSGDKKSSLGPWTLCAGRAGFDDGRFHVSRISGVQWFKKPSVRAPLTRTHVRINLQFGVIDPNPPCRRARGLCRRERPLPPSPVVIPPLRGRRRNWPPCGWTYRNLSLWEGFAGFCCSVVSGCYDRSQCGIRSPAFPAVRAAFAGIASSEESFAGFGRCEIFCWDWPQ
jgi:hypothetical protein